MRRAVAAQGSETVYCWTVHLCRRLVPWFVLCWALSPPLAAQGYAQELQQLREEITRLRQELDALRREVSAGKTRQAGRETGSPAAASSQEPASSPQLELLQAQVAEHAQSKIESNSRFPVKVFGAIVSNTFFNSGEANWLDIPNLVQPGVAGLPPRSFSSTLRQSRVGAILEGPMVGPFRTSAVMAMDFFGGIPNFQTGTVIGLPRLLYAYARLEGERTAIELGQDQMLFAPNNPTSLVAMAFPNLYRSGNLYLRAPQARIERSVQAGEAGSVHLAAGILAPMAGDFTSPTYEFVPPNLAGERSAQPAIQGRVGWRSARGAAGQERSFEVGVSGHHGRLRFPSRTEQSWGAAVDFDVRAGRFGLGGEWFAGENIAAFGGALGQFAKSTGGWLEGRLQATTRLEFNAGFGADRLFDRDPAAAELKGNSSVFGNFIYQFTPELASSLEYRWLSTRPTGLAARRNQHVNVAFVYRF